MTGSLMAWKAVQPANWSALPHLLTRAGVRVNQLRSQLGERLDVPVEAATGVKPPDLAARAFDKAQKGGFSVMIVDTAGRSQLDAELVELFLTKVIPAREAAA